VAAPIPIAVVGAGFGARIQVPGFRASRRFAVAALVGRRPERVRRVAARLGVPHALTSLEEALALPGLAAVSIATPPDTHAAYTLAAARAGLHVLCEKPMARSVAEAEAMRDAVAAAGVVGLVDHEFRFEPARATLGRLIAGGDLGRPRLVTCVANVSLFADPERPVPSWWFEAEAGGGWLGASGSHLIDALRLWLGEFAALVALTDAFTAARRVTGGATPAEDAFSLLRRGRHAADRRRLGTAVRRAAHRRRRGDRLDRRRRTALARGPGRRAQGGAHSGGPPAPCRDRSPEGRAVRGARKRAERAMGGARLRSGSGAGLSIAASPSPFSRPPS